MLKTQKLIVITGNDHSIIKAREIIKGFKAVTVIRTVNQSTLENVYHFNKNAVYFSNENELSLSSFSPIVIQLSMMTTSIEKMMLSCQSILDDFPKLLATQGIDVGDHVSASTDSGYIQPESECIMCKIRDRNSPNPEHILYESDNFFVVPGTGAFYQGYVMIVPKRHVMSFANLNDSELDEFYIIYSNISSLLANIYGKKVFGFECGSGKTGAGKHKTSIVHAHFHMACTNMPVLTEIQASGLTPQLISKTDLVEYNEDPYMLYVDQDDNWYISCDKRDYYPRQHPRQVLAHWMQKNDREVLMKTCSSLITKMSPREIDSFFNSEQFYNWRNYPLRERMEDITRDFRNFCSTNLNKLSLIDRFSIRLDD